MMEANGGFGVEFGPHNRCAAPLPVGLSRLIPVHVTMQTKNMHDDVFRHHGIAVGRLDLAERCIWQRWTGRGWRESAVPAAPIRHPLGRSGTLPLSRR